MDRGGGGVHTSHAGFWLEWPFCSLNSAFITIQHVHEENITFFRVHNQAPRL